MKPNENPAATFHWQAPWRRGWLGGIVKSAAKSEAARRNGRKGGRPPKTQAAAATAPGLEKPKHGSAIVSKKPKLSSNCGPTNSL